MVLDSPSCHKTPHRLFLSWKKKEKKKKQAVCSAKISCLPAPHSDPHLSLSADDRSNKVVKTLLGVLFFYFFTLFLPDCDVTESAWSGFECCLWTMDKQIQALNNAKVQRPECWQGGRWTALSGNFHIFLHGFPSGWVTMVFLSVPMMESAKDLLLTHQRGNLGDSCSGWGRLGFINVAFVQKSISLLVLRQKKGRKKLLYKWMCKMWCCTTCRRSVLKYAFTAAVDEGHESNIQVKVQIL